MSHSKFAPSKMNRILLCSASFDAQDPEGKSNIYAEEGTMLHDKQAQVMQVYFEIDFEAAAYTITKLTFPEEFEGTPADYKSYIEENLHYVHNLIELNAEYGEPTDVFIEQRVSLGRFAYTLEVVNGTPDLRFCIGDKHLMYQFVIDWKFGQGFVSADQNVQLMLYGAGSCDTSKHIDKVSMHIAQPKITNYSCYELDTNDLFTWVVQQIHPLVVFIQAGKREFCPGEVQCQWCPWRGHCDARNGNASELAESVFAEYALTTQVKTEPTTEDLEYLASLLGKAKQLEKIINDITAYGMQRLSSGEEFPGHKLVEGRANRSFFDEDVAADFLLDYGIDVCDIYAHKLVSPAQAEKLLSREDRKGESFTSLITKSKGKPTMVPESDPREQLQCGAEATFKHLAVNK